VKAYLMHPDRDFAAGADLPDQANDLVSDLGLETLFAAMAAGDEYLLDIARTAVLSSLVRPEEITYRQQVLDDCLRRPEIVRDVYGVAVEAITARRRVFSSLTKSPDSVLRHAVDVLGLLSDALHRLRELADDNAGEFSSPGFTQLWQTLLDELNDDFLDEMAKHLRRLRFPDGVPLSAQLGPGNKGVGYVLRQPSRKSHSFRKLLPFGERAAHTFAIDERDTAGSKALSELSGRGVNDVANALAQSTDHVLDFFRLLRAELGFYVGCLNLHERLAAKSEPSCVPDPRDFDSRELGCRGLYDVCLSLRVDERIVGNDVDADGKSVIMITGANQGGKSTFLRSLGQAQLMMQCGMFAPAESFHASSCPRLFTHYKRAEDPTMTRGRLDEELARMSDVASALAPGSLLLCNESFSSTNEREGSQIARTLIRALTDSGMRVAFVTHLFDLADELYDDDRPDTLFLRAAREADGRRTFRLSPGKPLPTGYGEDLYRQVFGADHPAERPPKAGGDQTDALSDRPERRDDPEPAGKPR
jgi:DNA mismatch repair ATPase MutS